MISFSSVSNEGTPGGLGKSAFMVIQDRLHFAVTRLPLGFCLISVHTSFVPFMNILTVNWVLVEMELINSGQ